MQPIAVWAGRDSRRADTRACGFTGPDFNSGSDVCAGDHGTGFDGDARDL